MVGRQGNEVGFVARDGRGNFYYLHVEKERGRWRFAGLGECKPGPELALKDASIIEWVLDPDASAPEAGDRVIDTLVSELACHGFGNLLDRMNEPRVLHHGAQCAVDLVSYSTALPPPSRCAPRSPRSVV